MPHTPVHIVQSTQHSALLTTSIQETEFNDQPLRV